MKISPSYQHHVKKFVTIKSLMKRMEFGWFNLIWILNHFMWIVHSQLIWAYLLRLFWNQKRAVMVTHHYQIRLVVVMTLVVIKVRGTLILYSAICTPINELFIKIIFLTKIRSHTMEQSNKLKSLCCFPKNVSNKLFTHVPSIRWFHQLRERLGTLNFIDTVS